MAFYGEYTTEMYENEISQLKEKYKKLEEEFEEWKNQSIKWSLEDFLDYEGYEISEENAQIALEEMIREHDCNYGITWETVEMYLDKYGKYIGFEEEMTDDE